MEEEQSSTSSRPIKRFKKSTSIIWELFDKFVENGIQKSRCKKCDQVYISEHGTSNMRKHMMSKHGEVIPGDELEIVPFEQSVYRNLMGKSIVQHNLPFSFVEYDGIREMHRYLNHKVQDVSRNTIKADIMDIYGIEKRKVKQELESLSGRICLTSDLWSSSTMDGYLSLTAHYVDENWNLQSRILNLRFMPPPHTGQLLAEKFIGLLKEWGIEIKVFSLTVDNASANNSFVEILKSHLNMNGVLLCDGDYFHVRCGAHILNLIVQSGLKVVDNCVSKVREMVRYVRGTKARMIKLAEFVSQLSINCKKKLSQDVSTRWNSTYVMLESALQYKVALSQYGLVDKNVGSLTDEEWAKIYKICQFLKPFYDITVLFSGSQYPTSNLYFHGVYKIQSLISMELQDESSILYETAFEMNEKFKKYWENYSLILSFAVILDPRYKLKFVEYVFRKIYPTNYSEKVRHIYKKMEELYLDYCRISSISSTSVTSCPRVINEDHDEAMDDIDEFESIFCQNDSQNETKSQLDLYLEESKMDARVKLDVLSFWRSNKSKYSILSIMARDILSMPITTVASESSFSIGSQIISKYRGSITPDNAEALLCTRGWLYGYKVFGDEESDSEDSIGDVEKLVLRLQTPD